MRLLMATVASIDGEHTWIEAEPVALEAHDGVVSLRLDDGTVLEFDAQQFREAFDKEEVAEQLARVGRREAS